MKNVAVISLALMVVGGLMLYHVNDIPRVHWMGFVGALLVYAGLTTSLMCAGTNVDQKPEGEDSSKTD